MSDRGGWVSLSAAGRRGRCLTLGRGADVAILPSPLAPADCYLPTALRLAGHFRTHLIEMPGSGRSEQLDSPWSVSDYAGWAAAAISERGLTRPAVVAHSYSGAVGVVLAARHPESVGALVVVDSIGAGPNPPVRAVRGGLIDVTLDAWVVAARWHQVARNALNHWRNYVALLGEALRADVTAEARRVRAPVLLAWGAREHTMPPWAVQAFLSHLPDARLYLSPRGTHTWLVSQPDEFARAVAAFLTRGPSLTWAPAAAASAAAAAARPWAPPSARPSACPASAG